MAEQTSINEFLLEQAAQTNATLQAISITLGALDAKMDTLCGEDGRIKKLEDDVRKHNQILWGWAGIMGLGTLGAAIKSWFTWLHH